MREPRFWFERPGLAAAALAPIAAIYGAVTAHRMGRPGRRLPIPVVCVGNLTVGGAGKTPTTIAIARLLQASGARPVILSRGYGGRLAGPVVVTPDAAAADVGDEPLLLARAAPTIVAHDRVAGADAALEAGANVLVMDDEFQNPSLVKTLALVVLDGRRGIGNGRVFPAGPLRAPLGRQLGHANAVLCLGEPEASASAVLSEARARGLPVFAGTVEPDPRALADLAGERLVAYAGIADPEKFFATLRGTGLAPVRTFGFPDHHPFTAHDAERLLRAADAERARLVTTEKDLCRLGGRSETAGLAAASVALPVTMRLSDPPAFTQFLASVVRAATAPISRS